MIEFRYKNLTNWNSTSFHLKIKEGDLVIFPSWVIHSVDQNTTKNKERISLAFNTFPIGELGNYNDITQLKL